MPHLNPANVEVCFACRDDAESCIGHIEYLSVYRIGGGKSERCGLLGFESFLDLRAREIRPTVMQATGRYVEVRDDELWIRRQLHRHCRLDGFGYRFETHPHPGKTGQRDAIQAELEILRDIGGVQVWHDKGQERNIGLVRHRR